jgi:hypothetical protein
MIMEKILVDDRCSTNFHAALGVYAHGELENKIGTDIVFVRAELLGDTHVICPIEDGVQKVLVVAADGTEIPAVLYKWSYAIDEYTEAVRGLVVLEDDSDAVNYARECYDNGATML